MISINQWIIEYGHIKVKCDCGEIHMLSQEDLHNCVNITCLNCGRMISAHIDIEISPASMNPQLVKESDQS